MSLIMTDVLRMIPSTSWPWIVIGATIILGIVGMNPQAGDRIITFMQRIKDLFSSSHPRRKVKQSSHVDKKSEDK
jgi:hypothetical protein